MRRWKIKINADGNMPSPNQREESRHHSIDRSNRSQGAGQIPAGRITQTITWVEATMAKTLSIEMVIYKTPTFHTIAKDGMIPF